MKCEISSVVQRVDLIKNSLQNFLVVVLPTGETIQCPIDDAVAERVMKAHIQAQTSPPSVMQAESVPSDVDVVTSAPALYAMQDGVPAASPYDTHAGSESDHADDGVPSV